MDFKTTFFNTTLAPFYAGSGTAVSITNDGSLLATSVLDVINIVQLKERHEIVHKINNDDEQEITALKLTPDGSYLCFVAQNQLLRIYSLASKKIVRSMKVSSPVYVMDCDETSTLLVIGGTDGSVSIFDIENGYVTHSFKGHGGIISSVKFYGELDGANWLLASGDTNGVVKIWDLVKRRCMHTIQEHTAAVRGLDFCVKDSEMLLISGGRDEIINLHHFDYKKTCKLLKTLPVKQQIEACGFIANHESLIYHAGDNAVYQIVCLQSGKQIKSSQKPQEELFIIGVLSIENGSKHYLVLSDQTLFLLDIEQALMEEDTTIPIKSKIAGNHGTIADMKFVGPNLDMLALATNSPTLRIIKAPQASEEDGQFPVETNMYGGHVDLLNALDASEDGLWIATASKDHTVLLWRYSEQLGDFKQYAKFIGHAGSVTAVALPNIMDQHFPNFLLSSSTDMTVKKWKVPKPTQNPTEDEIPVVKTSEYTRRAHEKDINALSISPNDSIFATASYDKTCKIWDLVTGELVATLANHKRGLWDVSFCQHDKLIATCSGDKTIKIWSLENYNIKATLEGHTNAVQRISFINKNKQLVSCGADGLVKIWDCSTGECLRTLDAHDNRIWALEVADDGDRFVTADADGLFQFWKDNSEEEHEQDLEKKRLKVEQEQSLQNYLSKGDWVNAFLLAMTLDHPMRLYNVLKSSISGRDETKESDDNHVFSAELDHIIGTLDDEQLLRLLKRCRDWNTNAKTYTVAQLVIKCIMREHNIVQLSEIPGVVQVIDALIPYTERHYSRVDSLVEQSYILDYALMEMDKIL
ncbi:U3 snoRNA-associated protein UTP13 Ecym_4134 [Eremothecium cymbalariae DBVPG|uniref:Uncharacterized protein n=1 Tax=Eremothecium cymbalariae (strain CBS 270.75 / DBVPG 7215 / KCTC 17166 / NRRL Y-17582) TaxID=931890 RepID=G8JT60_ERECY|nr:hypothetical protein Ecym_4134 [Eremothecium cymbalariae DBVPG\